MHFKQRLVGYQVSLLSMFLWFHGWETPRRYKIVAVSAMYMKQIKYVMKYQLYLNASKKLQLTKFVWTLRSSIWVVFNRFLLIDATDRSKICSRHRIFFYVSLYTHSLFANTPFTLEKVSLSNYYGEKKRSREVEK